MYEVRYNSWLARLILPSRYTTMMFFGTIQSKLLKVSNKTRRHESIHVDQYLECLGVGLVLWGILGALLTPWLLCLAPFTYYILYFIECLISIVYHIVKGSLKEKKTDHAYKFSAFEMEAYANEDNPTYFRTRRPFSFFKYYGKV